ncbi:MAG TPA: methyltransferase domain-containing protein [Gaiellaceae bacterium]|nr:methyltransferase domain-containing protein [Gaiellaceae bacterium]
MTAGGTAIPEVHALLRVLGAGRHVLEIGAAFGIGAAAMAETARSVVTVELDPERAAIARERLRAHANVELVEGDWREVVRGRSPFELVFADGGSPYDWEAILELAAVGGLIVKDDLTPGRAIDGDPVREFLLRDPRVDGVEILTTPATAAIVAARLR